MSHLSPSIIRVVTVATFIGSLAFVGASHVYAQEAPLNTIGQNSPLLKQRDSEKMRHSQKAMEQHVEQRIKTLHDKLDITTEQEAKWADVAQAMRDNENIISHLMKQRYENRKTMTAIDDLQSYETIAEAHADGLKKMISVFQNLYTDMSDDQKKDADEVFGRFEGHRDGKSTMKHG